MTMTSNCCGRFTSCIEVLSTLARIKSARISAGVVKEDREGAGAHHVVELESRVLVLLGDLAARVEEESVSELHDVGLVDAGDRLWGLFFDF